MPLPTAPTRVTGTGFSLERARLVLARHFGFPDFRPPQRRVIASVLAGEDVLGVLPTGAGKSVCFQVPGMLDPGVTLIVSPLISLMQDQVDAARRRNLPAGFVNSTMDQASQREAIRRLATGTWRLLYTAPERLARLTGDLRQAGVRISRLVVDEAHCISEWGHDFRPAYRAIGEARRALGWPQVVALTGSATPFVRDDIRVSLGLGTGSPARRSFALHLESFDRPNLRFVVRRARDERDRLRMLLHELSDERGAVIVYAATRNITESLARILWDQGHVALPYHAGLTKERRAETLEKFLAGKVRVVVATCAFGMGIDKPDVRLVTHWTLPPTPESYYQEAGRAGRDGHPARCVLLHRRSDRALHLRQVDVTFPREALVRRAWRDARIRSRLSTGVLASVERLREELRPERREVDWEPVRKRRRLALERLRAMERYATSGTCRRKALVGWFGERLDACGGCDRCGPGGR
jgi:ATP-dependent DNA helicase RecQ